MLESTIELLKQLMETPGGYQQLLNMSALELPFPLIMGWVALWFIVLSISSLQRTRTLVSCSGTRSGPLAVVIVTELFRLSTATEPAVFHEPWWLTALVPAVLGPTQFYDWGREGSPLVMALVVVGIAAVFGVCAISWL